MTKRKPAKTRKPRAIPLRQPGDYIRGPAQPLNLERDAAINDLSTNLTRLRALLRVIEVALNGLPADILTGDTSSGEVAEVCFIAVNFTEKLIKDAEGLSRDP
jgi:hypothetical protein